MNRSCRRTEWSFSPAYDGSLAPAEKAAFDSHLAECEACRESFSGFVRAMADLGKLRPSGALDDAYVAQVMSRVERAGTESGVGRISGIHGPVGPRRAFRFVFSHAAAAAIGVAATLAFWSQAPEFEGRGSPERRDRGDVARRDDPSAIGPIAFLPRALPVRFEGEERSFERNDRVERVAESFSLRPGETLRSLPSQRVAISLAETGELLIEVARADLVETPPKVHEIRFVELPSLVTVDRKLVDDAVDELERRVVPRLGDLDLRGSMSTMFAAISRLENAARPKAPALPAPDAPAVATEPTAPESTVREPEATPAYDGAFEAATFTAGTTPTQIRRSPDQTTLSLQGTLTTTIPELIVLLDDEDAEIADLAAARLDAIRQELEADPRYHGKLSPLPGATADVDPAGAPLFGFFKNPFSARADAPRERSVSERWTRWWTENAVVIATGRRVVDR